MEKRKYNAIDNLKGLCARCNAGEEHSCPVSDLIERIKHLNGVPVIVNEKLRHVVFNH